MKKNLSINNSNLSKEIKSCVKDTNWDAKRNSDPSKDSIHFYKRLGFELYKERDSKETPMYLDIFPYLKELTNLK